MYTDRVLPKYEFGIQTESLTYPNPYQYPLTELGHIVIEEQAEIEKINVDLRNTTKEEIKKRISSGEFKLDKMVSIYMPRETISNKQKETLQRIKEKMREQGDRILGLYYRPNEYVRNNIDDFDFFNMSSTELELIDSYIEYLNQQRMRLERIRRLREERSKMKKTKKDVNTPEQKSTLLGEYPGVKTSDIQDAKKTLTAVTRENKDPHQEQGE